MKMRIYSPTRNPMQSGQGKAGQWLGVLPAAAAPAIDPLMGWTGMPDTTQQVKLRFASKDEAIEYANKNNIGFELVEPQQRVVKPKSYAANFAFRKENRV